MSIVKDLLFIILICILFLVFRKNQSLKYELFNQRENFIQTLSHDIRVSTLAQIRGLDLLHKTYNNSLIDDIEDSCKYSLDMINMLLNTYRYDNGEQVLEYKNFNFADAISSSYSKIANLAGEKKIKFNYDFSSTLMLQGDRTEIEKVLYYLFLTVIYYAPKNSTVSISAKNKQNKLEVSINYFGKPLSEEECRRMFSNNPRFSTVGHGIKMYMCKKIIEFHGGDIYVNNISDKINNFTFYLPKNNNKLKAEFPFLSKLQPFRL